MVTNHDFDLRRPELAAPIAELNEMVASLKIEPPVQNDDGNKVYGQNVFGIRFSGNTELALGVDAVSGAFWPTDVEAVSRATASCRDYLLVCANYPDLDVTEALQYFTTFQPGTSPWIPGEKVGTELRTFADTAVNIDSSAKLKNAKYDILPPQYTGPEKAYPMNLFWLTQTMAYKMAIVEVNRVMQRSLRASGLELSSIPGAEPREIGDEKYKRFLIDPSTAQNSFSVNFTRSISPNTFHLTDSGLVVADNNLIVAEPVEA